MLSIFYRIPDYRMITRKTATYFQTNSKPLLASVAKGPFILHNPFAGNSGTQASEMTLIVEEVAEFEVTLHNPFAFELFVKDISLR